MKIEDLTREITQLNLVDAAALAEGLAARLGVSPLALRDSTTQLPKPPPTTEDEKTYPFVVTLVAVGERRIQVVRVLREVAGIGLAEARALIDHVPATIAEDRTRVEAEATRDALLAVGATVDLR